ncbi:MAG: DivIVA domain-containing protein, partial [Acidimicrobiia bacterium]
MSSREGPPSPIRTIRGLGAGGPRRSNHEGTRLDGGSHEFRLERRGYEKAQVEAVLARVVETLREYEEQIAAYEARLTEAEASQEAVRRTFLAAQRTHDEMLAEAQADATKVRQDAERHRHEAEAAVTTASEEAEATRAAAETQ